MKLKNFDPQNEKELNRFQRQNLPQDHRDEVRNQDPSMKTDKL